MWWLLKPDASKKPTNENKSDAPMKWVKVDLNGSSDLPQKPSKPSHERFLIREIKKSDKKSLRLPLKNLRRNSKSNVETSNSNGRKHAKITTHGGTFPVPSSWRGPGTPTTNFLNEKKYSVTIIKLPEKKTIQNLEPSLEEKLRILKEQENYSPPRPRYYIPKSHDEEHKPSESERKLCNWISLEIKPLIGRLEGSRRSVSSIGNNLKARSRRLKLWHEEYSHSLGRPVRGILLHNSTSLSKDKVALEKQLTTCDKEIFKPIGNLLRLSLPYDVRASPRIDPKEQQNEIEKGGHGPSRDKLADYNMLVESFRRQRDQRLDKEEARMLLCKGILHDNAQEYRKAVESYKEYLILCLKNSDKEGEAIAYNFIGCSLQEEQDLKLVDNTDVPSAISIQYEKAEEYHKLHAEVSDLSGKFMAHTNLGLLYANLGKWSDAAASHQMALKYATLLERPNDQGVAVGNLGFTLFQQKEWVTAKACMMKYLQICAALKDIHGQARAHYILGSISLHRKWYDEALRDFEASFKAAKHVKDGKLETLSKIMIGVAQGEKLLDKKDKKNEKEV